MVITYQPTIIGEIKNKIAEAIVQALSQAQAAGELNLAELADFVVEMPREATHGDFATNAALLLSKAAGKNPRQIAEIICHHFDQASSGVAGMEIAGPGFINFRMTEGWQSGLLAQILAAQQSFGESSAGAGQKVQVEFVSANPTGELHMGNARGAAIGDSLAALLELAGFAVEREYYINDAGNQIDRLGQSLEVRYLQALGQDIAFPEDGYHGEDLPKLMAELVAEIGNKYLVLEPELRRERLIEYALKCKLDDIRQALENFGVRYDNWFSEQSLHDSGKVKDVINDLKAGGWLLEKDDALWLDCTRFGDEKPEVLVRGNGIPTYYAADIAYHKDKFERGFDTVIDIWGADHHGHVARMKGAMECLGYQRDRLEVMLMQFVRLYQGGELLKMSKRTGTYVTVNELVEEVGRDAARFFFVMRSADSLIDFDMDLAKKQSADNPVYYVQYAHARIHSILAAAEEAGQAAPPKPLTEAELACLNHPSERTLIRKLADFPDEIITAALQREPHRIATYLQDVAALFHNFYGNCRVLSDDATLSQARLALALATAQVIKKGLTALGVSAPDQM